MKESEGEESSKELGAGGRCFILSFGRVQGEFRASLSPNPPIAGPLVPYNEGDVLGEERDRKPRRVWKPVLLEILANLGLDPDAVLGGLMLSMLVVVLLYRKFLFSLFDPLIAFIVAQIGDASVMWAMPVALSYKHQFIAYALCCWAGFALKGRPVSSSEAISFEENALFDLKFILAILCVIIVGANLYLGATVGFPLLSANPTEAKFTVYTGGLGLVRRIDMGPYYFFCSGCSLLIVANRSRRFAIAILCLATSFVLFGGEKSALLPLLFSLSFALAHKGICRSDQLRKKAGTYMLLILGSGVAIALVVTTKDQGGLVAGIQAFMLRFLLAGDVVAFYYPRHEIVMSLVDPTVTGYLQNMFADILSLLRISNFQNSLGSIISGSELGGPNAQYFILGDLFFGPIAGCVYCFSVGYLVAVFRSGFFRVQTRSAVRLALYLFLALVAFDFAMEASLFIAEVATVFLCLPPLYLLAKICRMGLGDKRIWMLPALSGQPLQSG